MDQRTYFSLLKFLCREGKDQKNLNHDRHDDVCHSRGQWKFGIDLESPKKMLDSIEEVKDCAFASGNTLNRL